MDRAFSVSRDAENKNRNYKDCLSECSNHRVLLESDESSVGHTGVFWINLNQNKSRCFLGKYIFTVRVLKHAENSSFFFFLLTGSFSFPVVFLVSLFVVILRTFP